jgi:hypothetical protein
MKGGGGGGGGGWGGVEDTFPNPTNQNSKKTQNTNIQTIKNNKKTTNPKQMKVAK